MATKKALLTAEDLFGLLDCGRGYELVDGELIEMTPPGWDHGEALANATILIGAYVKEHGLGRVSAGDPGIILRRSPDTVRGPDVAFTTRERLPLGQAVPGFTDVVPDFVVEVVSPYDRAGEVQAKVQAWLRAGVRLVWVLYPNTRTVVAWPGSAASRMYAETETIAAEPVLPGFSTAVGALFA